MTAIPGADLDHVAVAVEHQSDAWPRYAGVLGGQWLSGGETIGFKMAQLRYRNGMKVEVLEPHAIDRNDFLRRFLDRNGPGVHHMTYKVPDIVDALERAEATGYRPVGVDLSDPGWKEAFLHPKDAPGVVIQLAQAAGGWSSPPPAGLPEAEIDEPSMLVHVAHAVRDIADGRRLFIELLGGEETDSGEIAGATFSDIAWPGPGRVRLLSPTGPGPIDEWVGDRAGRVHHIAFSSDQVARGEITPENNHGVRLQMI